MGISALELTEEPVNFDENHREVEIVVDILVLVGGGGSRKSMWLAFEI